MAFVVGLDIGTRYLKGAVLAGTASKFRLLDFFQEEIPTLDAAPPEDPEEYTPPLSVEEVIQKVLADRNLKGADVVAAVESSQCVIRQFQVPFTREDQVEKVITYTAEEYFPAFSMDEVVLEYLKVAESNGKSQVLVAALRHETIEARLGMLKRATVDPVALDLDCAALFNAFALTPAFDEEKETLLVEMGATSTKIVHVAEGRIKKIRSFRTGAAAVTSADRLIAQPAAVGAEAGGAAGSLGSGTGGPEATVENRFDEIEGVLQRLDTLTVAEAEEGELEADAPIAVLSDEEFDRIWSAAVSETAAPEPPPEAPPPVEPEGAESTVAPEVNYQGYLERIVAEIYRTFATSSASIELVCLTGGLSDGEETRRYFNETLEVETIHLDLSASIPTDLDEEGVDLVNRHGATAVGLALKEFGKDRVEVDFRKGPFRYEHRFSRLKFPLLLLSVLCFAFFLQTAFWAYHQHQKTTLFAAAVEGECEAVYKEFFGKELAEGRSPYQAAKAAEKTWKGTGMGDVGKVVDAVAALRNFGEVMASTDLLFRVNNMKFDFTVRPKSGAGKKKVLAGRTSQVDLVAKDSDASNVIRNKFKEPRSLFFTAITDSKPSKDGYKITVKLDFKESALKKLE